MPCWLFPILSLYKARQPAPCPNPRCIKHCLLRSRSSPPGKATSEHGMLSLQVQESIICSGGRRQPLPACCQTLLIPDTHFLSHCTHLHRKQLHNENYSKGVKYLLSSKSFPAGSFFLTDSVPVLLNGCIQEGRALLIQRDNETIVGWQRMCVLGPPTTPRTVQQLALEVLAEITVASWGS